VLVQLCSYIHCCRLDGVEEEFGHSRLFDVYQVRLEHAFGSLEAL
jgi:hypothetical protein